MNGIRSWLLRIVACGFLCSLAELIPVPKAAKRALKLCCGCLMILTVLRPLIGLDLSTIGDQLFRLGDGDSITVEQAEEENRIILRKLILDQANLLLRKKANELGTEAEFETELRMDEASGTWVPWSVEIRGAFAPEQRAAFADYLEQELNIPAERQRWLLP